MLGPDSRVLTALLIAVSAGLIVGAIRFRLLPVKILCGMLSIIMAMIGGIAAVNYYYGYYKSWGQLAADFSGNATGNLGTIAATNAAPTGSGRIGWVNLPGKLSGYNRPALVYLPPQYTQAKYAKVRFPVVELFHGTPGSPKAWLTALHISQVADELIAKHLIGPMILVMPSINASLHDAQDCVNSPSINDETYLTKDVRSDVLARYRASTDSFEWGASGYSSGGYCAANLALRNPKSFGAAAIINGYYRAVDGPAHSALKNSQPLEAQNSPLYLAEKLTANSSPVPAFWVAAGTNDKQDYKPAGLFAAALDRVQQVPFITLHNVADTANGWDTALPGALTWLWQQLAPPDLRVLFPVRTANIHDLDTTLNVPPQKRGPVVCRPSAPSAAAKVPCVTATPTQVEETQVQTASGSFKKAAP
jgi:poly(3-hydroxybutyrate) depolymerase